MLEEISFFFLLCLIKTFFLLKSHDLQCLEELSNKNLWTLLLSLLLFCFLVTSGDTQGLLLAIHSGINIGGTIWNAGV